VSRYQKGKTNPDFTEARDSEWQWHPLDHMQVCTLLQTNNHASTPTAQYFTGRMPFLLPNQQCQSTEGIKHYKKVKPVWIEMRQDMMGFRDAVASAGPYANNLHLAADK